MHSKIFQSCHLLLGGAALTAGMQFLVSDAEANPSGMTVASGSATAHSSGNTLSITTGNNTVLNWQNFNIAAGETTVFNMPSTTSFVVNNIQSGNASQIYGDIKANGIVVLENQYGFYFGPHSFISVGGLMVSTAAVTPPQNTGGAWEFNGPPPLANIVNYGQLKTTAAGGSLYLIADEVENHGSLEADSGSIGLAAGQTVFLTDRPDGRGMSMAVTLPQGSVSNDGTIVADGGTIALNAQVVNQNGTVQANSVQEVNGQIELVASDSVNLGANSQISAQGDGSVSSSNGGTVTIQAGNTFSDTAGSQIVTAGGSQGGNGGDVEISAPNIQSLNTSINAGAQSGSQAGTFLLDPQNIILSTQSTITYDAGNPSGGSIAETGSTGFFNVDVNTAFANVIGNITLEASGNIYVGNGTLNSAGSTYSFAISPGFTWNLSSSTGNNDKNGTLTLEAGSSIIMGKGTLITDPNNWSISLEAANIYLNGASGGDSSGSLATTGGSITLVAGSGLALPGGVTTSGAGVIQLGAGSVNSAGGNELWQAGGAITLNNGATISDVNGGSVTVEAGYNFTSHKIASASGGITIGAGSGTLSTDTGNLNLEAGGAITLNSGKVSTSASGNLLWEAGSNITLGSGLTVAANGTGNLTLEAGYNFTSQSVTFNSGNLYLNGGNGADGGGSVSTVSGNLTLEAGSMLQLGSGSLTTSGGNLLAEAGSDVTLYGGGPTPAIATTGSGSLTIEAGYNFNSSSPGIVSGTGNLYLNGGNQTDAANSIQTVNGNLTLDAGNTLQLGQGTVSSSGGNIVAQAGSDILFNDNISAITDVNGGSITLTAGYNITPANLSAGLGNLILDGPNQEGLAGYIQNDSGNISLTAANTIEVGSGDIITTAGGNISAHSLFGSINTGSDANGYAFNAYGTATSLANAYAPAGGLGGISTADGGNVTLIAGQNVVSWLPSPQNSDNSVTSLTGGSGAFSTTAAGNVTVIAGGDVTGSFVEGKGTGGIYAGVTMDANGNPEKSGAYYLLNAPLANGDAGSAGTDNSQNALSLSLVNGGWNVAAAQNIDLQEVRNPNGVFDSTAGAAYDHLFDYAANDYVNLSAGNEVHLGAPAADLPRNSSSGNDSFYNVPVLYPPILNIDAGVGGVVLGTAGSSSTLTLFPSPQGSLSIDTSGSLTTLLNNTSSGAPTLFNLLVSDSGKNQYNSTGAFNSGDHAVTPVHENSPTPIYLNIGGNVDDINLIVPEAAQLVVGGNMINCGFQGENLSLAAAFSAAIPQANAASLNVTVNPGTTSFDVAGDILNRSSFTSITLSSPLTDLTYLSQAVDNSESAFTLSQAFTLSGNTLTYNDISGISIKNVLSLLNNLTVQVFKDGVPQWQNPGAPVSQLIPVTTTVSVLGDPNTAGTVANQLLTEYNSLGILPNTAPGYAVGGGGNFNITARTIDLGTSAGIISQGPLAYQGVAGSYPLAPLFINNGPFKTGANIDVTTTGNHSEAPTLSGDLAGDLDMYSSSIASLFGGSITLNASADVNAGSAVLNVATTSVRGIYTASGGDINVLATGNININGSRISTYDGGDISIESLDGNVNAGSGSSALVTITGYYEAPDAHGNPVIYTDSTEIPFSGITALTFPADSSFPAPVPTIGNILVETPNGNINSGSAGVLQVPINNVVYPDALVTLLAGYDLVDGSPVLVSANRDINVNGSGVIASNAKLEASGDINGLVFASQNIDINANANVNVTALGAGNVNVATSGGTISGTIIGVGGVSVSGGSVDAALVSANVSGSTSGSSGLGSGNAAAGTSTAASSDSTTSTATATLAGTGTDDDLKKKKGKGIALAQKVSRVTVLLPSKN